MRALPLSTLVRSEELQSPDPLHHRHDRVLPQTPGSMENFRLVKIGILIAIGIKIAIGILI